MAIASYLRRNGLCIAAGLLCIACAVFFLFPVVSLGKSMLPTLDNVQLLAGTPVFLNQDAQIHRGDIVVVQSGSPFRRLIKRMIAIPGDTLQIHGNVVYVNGEALDEPYLYEAMRTQDIAPMTLGEDQFFVLGDNRNISADSRYYGLFSRADILLTVDPQQHPVLPVLSVALLVGGLFCLFYLPETRK